MSGGRSVFTSLKANTHFGRPQLTNMFKSLNQAHPMVGTFFGEVIKQKDWGKMITRAFIASSFNALFIFLSLEK